MTDTLAAPAPTLGDAVTPRAPIVPPRVRELAPRLRAAVTLAPGASAPGARDEIDVRTPFTGEPIARVPRGTPADVEHALAAARAAQPAWALRPAAERARVVMRFHDLLLARQDECLDLAQLEAGKARRDAFEEL